MLVVVDKSTISFWKNAYSIHPPTSTEQLQQVPLTHYLRVDVTDPQGATRAFTFTGTFAVPIWQQKQWNKKRSSSCLKQVKQTKILHSNHIPYPGLISFSLQSGTYFFFLLIMKIKIVSPPLFPLLVILPIGNINFWRYWHFNYKELTKYLLKQHPSVCFFPEHLSHAA